MPSVPGPPVPRRSTRWGPESGRNTTRTKGIFERFGSRQEGVEAVAFLASEPPGYIAGQNLTVVGGYALGA